MARAISAWHFPTFSLVQPLLLLLQRSKLFEKKQEAVSGRKQGATSREQARRGPSGAYKGRRLLLCRVVRSIRVPCLQDSLEHTIQTFSRERRPLGDERDRFGAGASVEKVAERIGPELAVLLLPVATSARSTSRDVYSRFRPFWRPLGAGACTHQGRRGGRAAGMSMTRRPVPARCRRAQCPER